MTKLSLVIERPDRTLSPPFIMAEIPDWKLTEFVNAAFLLAKLIPIRVVFGDHVVTSVVVSNNEVTINGKPIVLIPKGEAHVA